MEWRIKDTDREKEIDRKRQRERGREGDERGREKKRDRLLLCVSDMQLQQVTTVGPCLISGILF